MWFRWSRGGLQQSKSQRLARVTPSPQTRFLVDYPHVGDPHAGAEAVDNGLLGMELAAGIIRVKSVKSIGIPAGNWLSQLLDLLPSRGCSGRERA
jgi:hypothetical protein